VVEFNFHTLLPTSKMDRWGEDLSLIMKEGRVFPSIEYVEKFGVPQFTTNDLYDFRSYAKNQYNHP